ncbi:MAG TPA: hypothetical protein VM578_11595 [Candidatus Saccharimonadales bacterium]|nr:hypothetical protein [Candidatus Saccharimonadales bacterium]
MRLAAAILLLTVCLYAATPPWKAAKFRGLELGRAHRDDVTRVLGAPDAANHVHGGDELIYRGRGEHKGDLTVRLDRLGVVTEIQEAFPVSIPRTQIYKELGKDAMTAHFSKAKCAGDALYRNARGAIELTLFPEHGIALWPDQYGYDFAAILYLAKTPGLARVPVCAAKR